MASAFKRKGSLHGVTLPRSWILENVQKLHRVQNKDANIRFVRGILTPFRDLLERIYSGTDADNGESNLRKRNLLPLATAQIYQTSFIRIGPSTFFPSG